MIEKSEVENKVVRICDVCGAKRLISLHTLYVNKKIRKRDQDLCQSCGAKEFYKRNPKAVGSSSKKWRGGRNKGYQLVYWRDKRTGETVRVLQHRLVMEKFLGRKLQSCERIHHIDMQKTNNEIENLFLCSSESEHQKVHARMEKCGFEMLGENIWFNGTTYTLSACSRKFLPEVDICSDPRIRNYGGSEYAFCYCPEIKRERLMHVLVGEELIGRRLFRNEVVHHIDGDTLNNSINNLQVMTISEHRMAHKELQQCVAYLYKMGIVNFKNGNYNVRGDGDGKQKIS